MNLPMDPEGQRLLLRLPDWLPEKSKPAVLVTVWAVQGSAPRQIGARLLCRDGRLLTGTIGGGHLEEQALQDAKLVAREAPESQDADEPQTQASEVREEADASGRIARVCKYVLGPQLAQCCGGVVWLHYQPVDRRRALQLAKAVHDALELEQPLETRFGGETLRETPVHLPTVLICGAGHVAAALARVLQPLPWRVVVVDQRPEWADPIRFPPTAEVVATEPLRLLAAWGWLGEAARATQAAAQVGKFGRPPPPVPVPAATYAVVVTHDHALDRSLVEHLLRVPEHTADPAAALAYVGMIGSKSKVASLHQRLRAKGLPDEVLARITAPIGLRLPEGELLGGNLPGEIAISVASQLLQVRQVQLLAPSRPEDVA